VAMDVFALAVVVAQGMSRGECLLYGYFKH
jgi:hypothetical protein